MGLFSKKDPCAICGGKVSGLFPWKVEGQLVCSECHGVTDLPDDMEKNLTLDEFKEYRKFREENQQLKEEFVITDTVDFGWFDTKIVFDTAHQLFCFDKNLNKTIFEGAQLKSFTIKEDSSLLYKGTPEGLMRYTSRVPETARAMAPQIMQYITEREIQERLDRLADRDREDGRTDYHRPSRQFMDLSEPFKEFNVELRFKHPYWKIIQCDMTGPTFSMDRPNINDYLVEYEEDIERVEMLVRALMDVAFPGAPERSEGDEICDFPTSPADASRAPADSTTEIRRYKELLADGIITEEEFAAKKRQLMGI